MLQTLLGVHGIPLWSNDKELLPAWIRLRTALQPLAY
jgi:hypothetical protein